MGVGATQYSTMRSKSLRLARRAGEKTTTSSRTRATRDKDGDAARTPSRTPRGLNRQCAAYLNAQSVAASTRESAMGTRSTCCGPDLRLRPRPILLVHYPRGRAREGVVKLHLLRGACTLDRRPLRAAAATFAARHPRRRRRCRARCPAPRPVARWAGADSSTRTQPFRWARLFGCAVVACARVVGCASVRHGIETIP